MTSRRARRFAKPRKPTFFWQGALILLPAVVLCGFGFYSLRQDRDLAAHQASERARIYGREAAQHILQGPLHFLPAPAASDLAFTASGPASPAEDPVGREAEALPSRIGILLNAEGQLIYPPSRQALPLPSPVDLGELTEAQAVKLDEFEVAVAAQRVQSAEDPALQSFLDSAPPDQFAALAAYRAGQACERAGRPEAAVPLYRRVCENYPLALSEEGFPLSLFAGARLLRALSSQPESVRKAAMDRFCGQILTQPTVLSERALEWARQSAQNDAASRRWTELFQQHKRARFFSDVLEDVPASAVSIVSFGGVEYLAWSTPANAGAWVRAVSRQELVAAIRQSIDRPTDQAQFALEVTLGNIPLLSRSGRAADGEILAVNVNAMPAGPADLTVRVALADEERYYADQRTRTLRFGALIGLSAAAVLVGFFSAWRAYHRQHRLNEMKTNFVSSVSHELRAPIASVRFMAEELEEGSTPNREKLGSYHRFIVQECRRLAAVIENVLDFARREQGREKFEFESTDLVRLLEETAALMRTYGAQRRITIETRVYGEQADVEADGAAIQRLLVNLLDNAIKHSPEEGNIQAVLEFTADRVYLWVEDEGPGIRRAEQKRIFERFYRVGSELRRETQGVGLGLSIVKHIAEVHGGKVHVRSELGKGSRFTLELPLERNAEIASIES